MSEQLLVDVQEAARMLGVKRSFLYSHLLRTGRLRSYRIGGARRISVEDVREFVRELRERSESDADV